MQGRQQPVRGVIFDKDGTLFDFRATWSGWSRRLLAELAGEDAARIGMLGAALGFDPATGVFAADSPVIAHTPDEIAAVLLPYLPGVGAKALAARMNTLAAEADMRAAVPLVPLIDALSGQGVRIGLVTNDAEAAARAHLHRAGILERFHFIAGYDSGLGTKPDAAPLLAFARAAGLRPAEVVMVGDSAHDLHAGRAAGMRTVAVLTGIAGAADLLPLADAVFPDIGHLPGWIAEQMRG